MAIASPRRVLYFNHDLPQPSGGVRTIYDHVAHLNRNQINAFVVHQKPGFVPGWFTHQVPILYSAASLAITPSDILIVPESMLLWKHLKPIHSTKIVFCQNHFFAFDALRPGESWKSLGVSHVLCSSQVISDFLRTQLGWDEAPVVHYSIDSNLFRPQPKKRQIAFMPRKRHTEVRFIHGLFNALEAQASQWEWVVLHNMSIDQVAQALGESTVFLSLSHLEGFGLPPLEAMACGCLVVGYHGFGGLDYATPQNGLWNKDDDPIAAARLLREATEMLSTQPDRAQRIIQNGIQTAAQYTKQREETEIVSFMKSVLG